MIHMNRRTDSTAPVVSRLLIGSALCLAASLVAAPVSAQDGGAPFIDRLDVRNVLVDVVVESRNGEPVLDLTADDFRVTEDGKPVEILSFTPPTVGGSSQEIGARRAAPEAAARTVPRRTVVLFDELHMHPNHRKRVLQQTRTTVRNLMDDGDEVMLARFDGQLRVMLPFTTDRKAVLDKLKEENDVRRVPMRTAWRETERTLAYIANLQEMNTDAPARNVQGPAARPSGDDPCVQNGHIARKHAQDMHSLASASITGLFQMVGSLARRDGRKMLLYVSDGLPLTPGTAVYRFAAELCDGTGASRGQDNAIDTALMDAGENTRWDPKKAAMELAEFEMTREWRQLAALANAKEVSVYPLQASGLSVGRSAGVDNTTISMGAELAHRLDIEDSMHLIADQTGGSVIKNTNDFATAMGEVLQETDRTYRLSYAPLNPGDGREHRIDVAVDRENVRLRHRKSYLNQTAEQRMADAVIATLLHGEVDNPLTADLGVRAGEPPKDKGKHVVQVRIELPLESLTTLAQEGVEKGQFTVLVAARDDSGRFTPVGNRAFPVSFNQGSGPEGNSYVYEIALPLRGDGATIAVAVRDDVSGTTSFLKQAVDLPIS